MIIVLHIISLQAVNILPTSLEKHKPQLTRFSLCDNVCSLFGRTDPTRSLDDICRGPLGHLAISDTTCGRPFQGMYFWGPTFDVKFPPPHKQVTKAKAAGWLSLHLILHTFKRKKISTSTDFVVQSVESSCFRVSRWPRCSSEGSVPGGVSWGTSISAKNDASNVARRTGRPQSEAQPNLPLAALTCRAACHMPLRRQASIAKSQLRGWYWAACMLNNKWMAHRHCEALSQVPMVASARKRARLEDVQIWKIALTK